MCFCFKSFHLFGGSKYVLVLPSERFLYVHSFALQIPQRVRRPCEALVAAADDGEQVEGAAAEALADAGSAGEVPADDKKDEAGTSVFVFVASALF